MLAGGAAAVAPLAQAATRAELAALAPQQVVERFVAVANARDPEVAKCELLTRDRRDAFVVPAYAGLNPRLPESWSEPNRMKACDAFVAFFNGFRDTPDERWERTEAGAAVVIEQRDDAVHLRVLIESVQRPPIGIYDSPPVRSWRDLLPNRQASLPGAGVLHRP